MTGYLNCPWTQDIDDEYIPLVYMDVITPNNLNVGLVYLS